MCGFIQVHIKLLHVTVAKTKDDSIYINNLKTNMGMSKSAIFLREHRRVMRLSIGFSYCSNVSPTLPLPEKRFVSSAGFTALAHFLSAPAKSFLAVDLLLTHLIYCPQLSMLSHHFFPK